ncbi:MAG: amidohydrolase family protein [bacterium]|nr:amidohydrolase family protein [bacterium]
MFIDIHGHTLKSPVPTVNGIPWVSPPDHLVSRYDALGIERAVMLPLVNPECCYASQSVEEILEICDTFPGRFIPFCNIDPRSVNNSVSARLDHLLRHYRDRGCKGIGEVCANLPFLHPMVQNLFRHVQDVGFPLTFHISPEIGSNYGLYDDPGLPQLERSLALFPNLRFLAHSQAFWAEMAPLETPADRWGYPSYPIKEEGIVPKLMRRYPNLLGDLSAGSGCNALTRDPDYAVTFLNEFQDRLFFGTDICAPDTETPLVDFLIGLRETGRIDEAVFRKVARENAVKLLELE